MLQAQVALRTRREPLQIPYPSDFRGQKTGDEDDSEFYLSTEPRFLSLDEIKIAEAFVLRLPYPQGVVRTGAVLVDPDDPLLNAAPEELDKVESENGLSSSKYSNDGTLRSPQERVLLIRERGYLGNGKLALRQGA